MVKSALYFTILLSFLMSCNEAKVYTQTELDSLAKKHVFLKIKLLQDTIKYGNRLKVKTYLSNESYKKKYYKHRGMIGVVPDKSDLMKIKVQDYFLLDSLNVNNDSIIYVINTSKLPHNNGHYKRYLLTTGLFLKNKETNLDTIYFTSKKEFVVRY